MSHLDLDYADGHISPPLEPTPDDQGLVNDVLATRPNGGEARATLESGPLSVQDPPDGVGRYERQLEVNVDSDGRLPDVAGWALHHGTWDDPHDRFPLIRLNLRRLSLAGLDGDVAALDVGDRLTIQHPPEWLPPDDIDQYVLGYTESIAVDEWTQDWHTTPAGPFNIARVAAEGVQFVGATLNQDVEPAGVQPGDLLVALTMNDGAPLTGPAGWTLQAQVQGGVFGTVSQVWTLVRGTSPPDLEWSSTAPDFTVVAVHAWRNAELASPVLAAAASTVAPSQTAPAGGALLVCLYTDSAWQASAAPPGMTRRDVAEQFQLIVAEEEVPAGPTGTREFVGADPSGAFSLLLGSATPPPGPGDPVRYDTAGCVTADPLGEGDFHAGSDTALHVTTNVGPEWTTDPADLPFDINVAGVRLRVTAVAAGLFGTQTMTVEQAPVNGVLKTIPSGTPVSLWTPARIGL